MARFFKEGRRRGLTVVRLLLRHLFQGGVIPALAGRFISSDEGHGSRQRPGYQVTPKLSLSCPMHAGNKPKCVQKMAPPEVKQATYGETRTANIKKAYAKQITD